MDENGGKSRKPFELEESPLPRSGKGNRRKTPTQLNKRITIIMLVTLFGIMAVLVFTQLGGKKPQDQEPLVAESQPEVQKQVTPEPPASQAPEATESDGPQPSSGARTPARKSSAVEPPTGSQVTFPKKPAPDGQVQKPESVAEPSRLPGPEQVKKPAVTPKEGPRETTTVTRPGETSAQEAKKPEPAESESTVTPSRPAPQQTAKQTPAKKPATPAGPKNQLKNIKIKVEHAAVVMDILAERPIEHYKFFSLPNPQRMVVDLLGPFKEHAPTMQAPQNNYVSGLRIGDHPDKLRIVADIKTTDRLKMQVERVNEKQVRLTITR